MNVERSSVVTVVREAARELVRASTHVGMEPLEIEASIHLASAINEASRALGLLLVASSMRTGSLPATPSVDPADKDKAETAARIEAERLEEELHYRSSGG